MDEWLELHDRQVLVVEGVSASHEHLMAEGRMGHPVDQHEPARDMRAWSTAQFTIAVGGLWFCTAGG